MPVFDNYGENESHGSGSNAGGGAQGRITRLPSTRDSHALVPDDSQRELSAWRDVQLWDYLHILMHRRWTVAAVLAFTVLSALIVSFSSTPMYRATALLQIEPEGPNVVQFGDMQESISATQAYHDFYRTQYDILSSRQVALRTIEELGLEDDKWLNGEARFSLIGRARSLVGGLLSSEEADPERVELEKQHRLLDNFIDSLGIQPRRRSFLVEVTFSSPEPEQAARVAESVAREYVDLTLDQQIEAATQGRNFISKQLDVTKARLEESEVSLQEFARGRNIYALEQEEEVIHAKLADLNTRLTEAEAQRISLEAIVQQASGPDRGMARIIVNSDLLMALTRQLAEAEADLSELSDRFTGEYPKVKSAEARVRQIRERIAFEESRAIGSISADHRTAIERESMLREQLEQQRQVVAAYEEKAIDFKIMRREVDTNRLIYENLLQRMKEVEVTEAIRASNITIIDTPEIPLEPSSPRVALNLALSLLVGLLGGVGVSFFQEYADDSIRTPEEVERYLRLPMLGAVPEFRGKEKDRLDPQTSPDLEVTLRPTSAGAEAIRTLRASLFLAAAGGLPGRLLVTSAQPSEGKTCMAVNLAAAIAQTGRRVVVIDCDLRRPRVHKAIGGTQSPGVTNFLAGNAELDDVIRGTAQVGLDFVAAGPIPPNPVDLLDSVRMDDLINALEDRYDHIVVDAPPSLGFADVPVLSNRLGGGCLLVTKCGSTSRRTAKQACEYLTRMQSKLLGVVLNRIGARASSYSYYQYYGYYGSYDDPSAERVSDGKAERLESAA